MNKSQVNASKNNPPVLLPAEAPNCYYYGDYQIELVYDEEGESLETLLLHYLKNRWEKEE